MLMRILRPRVVADQWQRFSEHFRRVHRHPTAGALAHWLARDLDDRDAGFIVVLWDCADSERNYQEQPEMRALTVPGVAGEFETHAFEVCSYRRAQG
jgi:heme-degrading monooxygenase HmoA